MSKFEEDQSELIKLAATYGELFKTNDDMDRFNKIKLFGKKLVQKEYLIGFAGHFSAGKSSMINALTGGDLLPSSPIPTSANIVKVRKTETDYAIIRLNDGRAVKYGGHGFSDAIKSFSKDGTAVSFIEIGHNESALPEGITVMDTPGVDSTDDAHRLSTESALHLADLVFYTMDYNHVQSELNFSFTKELLRYNSNVYLIINQIDKHRESELPFEQFKQSVEKSFKMWGVAPKGIFYTSLVDLSHPHNDFEKVKEIVERSMVNWEDRFIKNAHQTIIKLHDEHIAFLEEKIKQEKEDHAQVVLEDEWSQGQLFSDEIAELEKTIAFHSEDIFTKEFERERQNLLQNAAITPYETRELLKGYLESLSPQFKVGFIFGAKKTVEERTKRKEAFSKNIQDLIHTQIEVHLKTLMKKMLADAQVLTDERSLSIDNMELEIPFETIVSRFNASDVLTGDTVLNNSNQVKSNITNAFRQLTDRWKDNMSTIISATGSESAGTLQQKLQSLKDKLQAIEQVDKITNQLKTIQVTIENPTGMIKAGRNSLIQQWNLPEVLDITEYNVEEIATPEVQQSKKDERVGNDVETSASNADLIGENAYRVATVVKDIPGFMETADYLRMKADRLEEQEFTVALFGAFSAGKSSFSNALIGENILPVSPNPTTATINRIRPVSVGKENDTADVLLKTKVRMTADVIRSFEILGVTVDTLEEAFEKVDEALKTQLEDGNVHIHKAFITAFKKGYPKYGNKLGSIIRANREQFTKFVAEEERSCFVESIDFYFDCELTRKGITLVDTPGADSINARHTDVAFEYIRNADAILFVTYYNHAFARADREFLIQLGRVKDAFELDKMFFIVNAIDLATNKGEAESVLTFVEKELLHFGIRNPRVHGISSLQALEAKGRNSVDPNIGPFEREFHEFLEHDLKGLAVQSLEEETIKATERLANLISRTELNMKRKSARLLELNELEEKIRKKYEQSFVNVFQTSATNELNELVYYILQRVFLRFSDFFREGYNPAVFRNKSSSQALNLALEETVNMVGFDLTQELKVTNLRMHKFLTNQLKSRQRTEMNSLKEIDETFSPILFEPDAVNLLTFENPFIESAHYSSVNRLFRNERSFFERGDRDKLRNQLEELLKKDSKEFLEKEKGRLEIWAIDWIVKEAEALREHLLRECLTQIDSERTLLEGTEQIEEWRAMYETLVEKELV